MLTRYPAAVRPPAPHTCDELASMMALLRAAQADIIAVGHGRDPASITAARALADAWITAGGTVLAVVDWPAVAASWLRPARRLTAGHPDAWIIADNPAGCAQLARRLADQPCWSAMRTVAFADLASPDLVALAGPALLAGMRGALADGGTWQIEHDNLVLTNDAKPTR